MPIRLLSFGEVLFDCFEESRELGGAPLNLAAHAALAGAEAYLASAVGDDPLGDEAIAGIASLGVRCDLVGRVQNRATGQCLVTLDAGGSPTYNLLDDVAYDYVTLPEDGEFDVFAFGTLALRREGNRIAIRRILKTHTFREVFTDLNIRPPFFSRESIEICLNAATIVKISDEELPTVCEVLFGEVLPLESAIARILAAYPGIRLLLLTQGERGSVCYREGRRYEMAITPAPAISTVGAGDSFGATFLVHYLGGEDIPTALAAASAVAAFVVSHRGAVPDGIRELLASLK